MSGLDQTFETHDVCYPIGSNIQIFFLNMISVWVLSEIPCYLKVFQSKLVTDYNDQTSNFVYNWSPYVKDDM